MTEAATISVALCTYNGERFLRAQLESIFSQSVRPTEIVIADDGSTDGTVALVETLEAEDRAVAGRSAIRITVLRNPDPLGVAANFARAIGACTGELVLLCDQDDVWRPNRIERAVAEFSGRPDLLLLHSDAALIDAAGNTLPGSLFAALGVDAAAQRTVHRGEVWSILVKRNIVTGATTALRRSLADIALPVPEGWLHDEWFAIVAAAVGSVDLLGERLIEYRQHGANQVGVRVLGVSGKVGRMLEPGRARNERLLARASSLVERLPAVPGVSEQKLADSRAKLVHERVRCNLGSRRVTRVAPVLREVSTGRYNRFGRGVADAARDILQPLAPLSSAPAERSNSRG